MRINKFIALASGLSRRGADAAITEGRVQVNSQLPQPGQNVTDADAVTLDGAALQAPAATQTILFNKPRSFVVSREGQGSRTIYDLLPAAYHQLKPVGRLDKDSSGLILLTNDGTLAQQLTHPSHRKVKIYEVTLVQALQPLHRQIISEFGVQLPDGTSKLRLERLTDGNDHAWRVTMHEGRNRQIRRTFAALGYDVHTLHRIQFGDYRLEGLRPGSCRTV